MNADKIIHEARGLCWHEDTTFDCMSDGDCVKCGVTLYKTATQNPDYTDPFHYFSLTIFMREKDRWRVFGNWLMRTHGDSQFRFLMKCEQEQITLIAECIEAGVLP